jgi:hypothetical protein
MVMPTYLASYALQVLEAEEMDVAGQVRALKGRYKEQHSELQMMCSEVEYTSRLLERCTQELVLEFSDWSVPARCAERLRAWSPEQCAEWPAAFVLGPLSCSYLHRGSVWRLLQRRGVHWAPARQQQTRDSM